MIKFCFPVKLYFWIMEVSENHSFFERIFELWPPCTISQNVSWLKLYNATSSLIE